MCVCGCVHVSQCMWVADNTRITLIYSLPQWVSRKKKELVLRCRDLPISSCEGELLLSQAPSEGPEPHSQIYMPERFSAPSGFQNKPSTWECFPKARQPRATLEEPCILYSLSLFLVGVPATFGTSAHGNAPCENRTSPACHTRTPAALQSRSSCQISKSSELRSPNRASIATPASKGKGLICTTYAYNAFER